MKKLLVLALSLSLILACMSGITFTASAATLNGVELAGEGTAASPYIIDSAAKFIAIFGNGNTDTTTTHAAGVTYLLTEDITLADSYKPAAASFKGTLLGAKDGETRHKLTLNVTLATTDTYAPSTIQYYGAVFHYLDGATVKNLEVYGTANSAKGNNGYFGVIAGYSKNTTVDNVDNHVDVTGGQKNGTGGFLGNTSVTTISNCTNYGDITTTASNNTHTAGIVGEPYKSTVINCVNKGAVTSTTYASAIAGGIIGKLRNDGVDTVLNCKNYGTVTASTYSAGIAGEATSFAFSITGCENYGNIVSTGGRIAGILGKAGISGTISKCSNNADLTANLETAMQAGGILGVTGKSTLTINIENCYNKGNITASATSSLKGFAAGMVGWHQTGDTVNVTNCYNLGEIKGYYKGSVAGQLTGTLNITNFYDLVNNSIKVVGSGTATSTTNTYNNSNVSGILALVDDTVWVEQEGYAYPSLAANPYKAHLAGLGDSTSPYRIYSAGDLKLVSDYPSATYKQILDVVDMDEMLCTETPFSGTFDGNGKSITLNIVDPVGKVDGEDVIATSTNLILTSLFNQTAGASSSATAVIKNVTTKGTVNGNFHGANSYTGTSALIGKASNTTVTNCVNYADVSAEAYRVAGLICLSGSSITLTNCYNYGNIYGSGDASGIISQFAYAGKMTNCGNYGNVTSFNGAAGITRYAQSANILTGNFNVGTIKATKANGGIATGLFADYNNGAKEIENSYNAGALIADVTYGIAYSSATTAKDGWLIENCYNATYADYPIASTINDVLTVTNCYYLSDEASGEYGTNVTKAELASIDLGSNFSVVSTSDYKYLQVTANQLNADKDNIDFCAVTVTDNSEEAAEIILGTGKIGSFYLPIGTEFNVTVKANNSDFYAGYVNGQAADEAVNVTADADKEVVITVGKISVVLPDIMSPTPYVFASEDQPMELAGVTYNKYALVASKTAAVAGLKLKEFGVFVSDEENVEENYDHKVVADFSKISADGSFGVLLYNEEGKAGGMIDNVTYYVLPYAVYVNVDGEDVILTGTKQNFVFEK